MFNDVGKVIMGCYNLWDIVSLWDVVGLWDATS